MRWSLAAVLTVSLGAWQLSLLGDARADKADLPIAWIRTEDAARCMRQAELVERVAARLEGRPLNTVGRFVEGTIRRERRQWVVSIVARDATTSAVVAQKTLASDAVDCAVISEAAALTIAVMLEGEGEGDRNDLLLDAGAPPESTESPDADALADSGPLPEARRADAGAISRRDAGAKALDKAPRPVVETSARAFLGYGLLPGVSPGVAVDGRFSVLGPFAIEWGIVHLPSQRAEDPTVSFSLNAGWLGWCFLGKLGRFAPYGCARSFIGDVVPSVYIRQPNDSAPRLWFAAGIGAGVALPIWRAWTLFGEVGVVSPITRHGFVLQPSARVVFEQNVFAPTASAGVGVRL